MDAIIKDMEQKLSALRSQFADGQNVTRDQIRRVERHLAAARKHAAAFAAAFAAFSAAYDEGA